MTHAESTAIQFDTLVKMVLWHVARQPQNEQLVGRAWDALAELRDVMTEMDVPLT